MPTPTLIYTHVLNRGPGQRAESRRPDAGAMTIGARRDGDV